MKILIIEDEKDVADYVAKGLRESGHLTDIVHDGKEGLVMATTNEYAIIILDRMLPNLDGITILKTLRSTGNNTPIILLSALSEVDDRVQGLKAGGDDYLVKPFAFTELLARVDALIRRNKGEAETITKLEAGDLEMDLLSRTVIRANKKLNLQAREFSLLEYLLRNKGQIVTRTMLLENVWHYHFDPQTNVIDVHISRLRRKVDDDFPKALIRTVRGSGYVIGE